MINYSFLTEDQWERVGVARKTRKFGHLRTWGEICFYINSLATTEQRRTLSYLAHLKNHEKRQIFLPLQDYPELVKEAEGKRIVCKQNITIRQEVVTDEGDAQRAFRDTKDRSARSKKSSATRNNGVYGS